MSIRSIVVVFVIVSFLACSRQFSSNQVDKDGYTLAWADEFNQEGKPDSTNWNYERGFVRNNELQWYQIENANCKNGLLIIEARKEQKPNPRYQEGSNDWRQKRKNIEHTSSCMLTRGKKHGNTEGLS